MRVVTPPMSSSFNSWGLNRNASSAEQDDDDSVQVDEDDQKLEFSGERRVDSQFDNHRLLAQREPCPAEHSNASSIGREGAGWLELHGSSPLSASLPQGAEGVGVHLSQSFLPYSSGAGGNNDSLPGEETFPIASSSASTPINYQPGLASPSSRRDSLSLSSGGSMLPFATRRLLEQNTLVPSFNADQQLAAQAHRRSLISSNGAYTTTSGAALLGVIDSNNFATTGASTNPNPYFSQAMGSAFPPSFVASAYSAAGVPGFSSGMVLRGGGVALPATLDFGTADGLSPYRQAAQSLPSSHHSTNANILHHHMLNPAHHIGATSPYGIGVGLSDMSTSSLFPMGANPTALSNSPLLLSHGGVTIGSLLPPLHPPRAPVVDPRTGLPENITNHPSAHGGANLKSSADEDPRTQPAGPVPGSLVEFTRSPEEEVGARSESNTLSSHAETSKRPQQRSSNADGIIKDEVKPKRPLSAYNLFFKDRRLELIAQREREAAAAVALDPASMSPSEDYDAARPTKKRRRVSKAKKIKIGFEEMAQIISAQWKEVDSETLAEYQRKAEEDKRRYESEMEEYRQKQRQGLEENQRALENSVDPETRMRYLATFGSKDDSL